MPGGARDGGTFHLLLISTLTGTRQTRLQAGSLFADRAPRPDAMASRSNGFRPVGERLGRTPAEASHPGRAREDDLRHEWPRAQNRGAVAAVGIAEYSMPPPEESSGVSLPRSRGKSRSEKALCAPQHDATVVSIPRSRRCSAPAESPGTRCLEAQLAQCEQTLWSVGSKEGFETGPEEKP